MSRINLLPWREEVKRLRNLKFYTQAGISAFIAILLVTFMHLWLDHRIEVEQSNINFLKEEEKKIVDKVKEIEGLKNDKAVLLERMKVIQSLEIDRLLVPKLLDVIPKTIPEGVYLKTLSRTADQVSIVGNAQTNANISAFMKNLEEEGTKTGFLNDIRLTEIKADKTGTGLDFNIQLTLGKVG